MNGNGFFKREPGKLQPDSRKLLESIGGEEIKTLEIVRTPLSSFTKGFLNTISLGQFEKISKKYYDQMFHLSLWINGKYNLEKNEVVYFNKQNPKKSNSQVRDVKNIPAGLTIQQLIDNAIKRMGPENFSNYDAEKLNCQNFLINVLDGSNVGNKEDGDFIFQDATKIFKELPEYAKVLGKVSVNLGAIFNRLIKGEGQYGGKLDFKTPTILKEPSKKRIYSEDEIVAFIDRLETMDPRRAYLAGQDFLRNAIREEDVSTVDETGETGATRELIEAVEDFLPVLLREIVVRTNNGEFAPDERFGTADDTRTYGGGATNIMKYASVQLKF